MSKVIFSGSTGTLAPPFAPVWRDASNWSNDTIPSHNPNETVLLNGTSVDDIGLPSAPVVLADVIGLWSGASYPTLLVGGFLRANNVENLSALDIGAYQYQPHQPNGNLVVRGSIEGVHDVHITSYGAGNSTGPLLTSSGGSTLTVGHFIGGAAFTLTTNDGPVATLILDDPTRRSFSNSISITDYGRLELADMQFDGAHKVSNGSQFDLVLTEHGRTVYQFTNVSAPGSTLIVGRDAGTGHDFVTV